jgi:hypothetical protein
MHLEDRVLRAVNCCVVSQGRAEPSRFPGAKYGFAFTYETYPRWDLQFEPLRCCRVTTRMRPAAGFRRRW